MQTEIHVRDVPEDAPENYYDSRYDDGTTYNCGAELVEIPGLPYKWPKSSPWRAQYIGWRAASLGALIQEEADAGHPLDSDIVEQLVRQQDRDGRVADPELAHQMAHYVDVVYCGLPAARVAMHGARAALNRFHEEHGDPYDFWVVKNTIMSSDERRASNEAYAAHVGPKASVALLGLEKNYRNTDGLLKDMVATLYEYIWQAEQDYVAGIDQTEQLRAAALRRFAL